MLPKNKYKHILISFWLPPPKNSLQGEPRIKNGKINARYFRKIKLNLSFKPTEGFWFSCGTGWYNWQIYAMGEKPEKNTEVYKIIIKEKRIIKLNTLCRLEKFMLEFGVKKKDIFLIDWHKVSQKYGGFKACPFIKQKVMEKYKNKIENYYIG